MSLDDNITRVHRPATYKPKTVYVAWKQDLWQQGDPLFYSIKDRRQIRTGPDHQLPLNPSAPAHLPPIRHQIFECTKSKSS
jgi:hypothetical protein